MRIPLAIAQRFLRPVNRFSQERYMTIYLDVLRGNRVLVKGKPLWLAPSIFFDVGPDAAITLGDRCVVSERVQLLTHDFSLDRYSDETESIPRDRELFRQASVSIGAFAFIGLSAIILPGVTIGRGAIVGAGAVVTRSVPDREVWAGNPARKISTSEAIFNKNRHLFCEQTRRH